MATPRAPLRRLLAYARHRRAALITATTFSILNKLFDLAPPMLIGAAVDVVVQREDSFLAGFGIESVDTQILALAAVTFPDLGSGVHLRVRLRARVEKPRSGAAARAEAGRLRACPAPRARLLRRPLHRRPDDHPRRRRQPARALSRRWCQPDHPAHHHRARRGCALHRRRAEHRPLGDRPDSTRHCGSLWFQKRLAPRYADVREKTADLAAGLANKLSGIATIKAFVAEDAEASHLERDSRAYLRANQAAIRLSSAFVPLIRMGIVLGFTATLVLGARMAVDGTLNVGLYSVLVFMTQRLLWPLTRLGNILDQYQRAMASTRRILDLLDTPLGIEDGPEHLSRASIRGEVTFEGVRFAYGDGPPVLHDIDVRITEGSSVAFVGPTGSGKSTLVKLLLRFYDTTAGAVCLDGHDTRSLALSDLRRAVGLVSQDVFLFHGTVRENIAYGAPDASQQEIEEAAKLAEAHGFIEELANGYDTMVGERGQKLSGGQRQRISLARAILVDPPILILDEATSAVDNETEAAIQRSLELVARDRTTIIIAHRLSTIRNVDCTYVIERGRITEQGSHDALLELGGTYASLWSVQTGERINMT